MKILFIHPPTPCLCDRRISPPLGLLYLAACVEKSTDIEHSVIDQNLYDDASVENCVSQALKMKADIYALSFGTTQYRYAMAISQALKNRYPESVVVLGGPHPTALPQETLSESGCDVVVESEGENTFLELVRNFQAGDRYTAVPGAYIRGPAGKVLYGGKRELISDLDTIPFPARGLVEMSRYTRTIGGEPATTIITARGCTDKCIFCSQIAWGKSLRLRSVENIMAEIDLIYERYGIRNILFLDDTLTADRKRLLKLCEELRIRGVRWRGWTRSNLIDPETALAMAKAKCMALCIGVESGSQKILDNLCKKTTVEQNRKALAAIHDSGMYSRVSLIVGSPGETWETVQETVDFVVETQPDDWLLSTFIPVPGCEAYTEPDKFGIRILNNENREDFYSNFFIVGGDMESGQVIEYEDLDRSEISRMRDYVSKSLREKCPPKLHNVKGIK